MSLREDSEKFAASVKVSDGLDSTTEKLVREALKLGYVAGVNDQIKNHDEFMESLISLSKNLGMDTVIDGNRK